MSTNADDVQAMIDASNDERDSQFDELGPLSQFAETGPVGPGGLSLAREVLGRQGDLDKENAAEYSGILAQRQQQANAARDLLRKAREELAARKYDPRPGYMDLAAALSSHQPGNMAPIYEARAKDMRDQQAWENAQKQGLLNVDTSLAPYGTGPNATDDAMLKDQLANLQLRMRLQSQERQRALVMAGRSGAAGQTPIEKALAAAGIQPGTPEYSAYMKRALEKQVHVAPDANAPVTLTDADKNNARAMFMYDLRPSTLKGGRGMTGEKWQQILDWGRQNVNPDWSESDYDNLSLLNKQFTSTKATDPGGQVQVFGTALTHAGLLKKLAVALRNKSDSVTINQIYNAIGKQFNKPAPRNFEAAVQMVGPELARAVSGGGQTGVSERELIEKLFPNGLSPASVSGVIDQTVYPLMSEKMQNLRSKYYSVVPQGAMHRYKGRFESYVSPEARAIMRATNQPGDWGQDESLPVSNRAAAPQLMPLSDRAKSYLEN